MITGCSTLTPEQVKVEQGIVQGTIQDNLRVFRGIPFAAPPVGDLRWKAPQPALKGYFQLSPKGSKGFGEFLTGNSTFQSIL